METVHIRLAFLEGVFTASQPVEAGQARPSRG